jgi:hypothetical protein
VCGIDQRAKFIVSEGGIVGKARFRADEIMDAIAVIRIWIEGEVLERWTEPDSAGSELFDIGQLLLHAGEFSTLESGEVWVVERLVDGRRGRVIEAIKHQEIDPSVSPVFGGRECSGRRIGWVDGVVENRLKIGSKQ